MMQSRNQLLIQKTDLEEAIRVLEDDRNDGLTDNESYRVSRLRLEVGVAEVVSQLDVLPPEPSASRSLRAGRNRGWLPVLMGLIAITALVFLLMDSVHSRVSGQAITGDVPQFAPTPTSTPSAQLLAAEREVVTQPKSAAAYLDLGGAYATANQAAAADWSYRKAMQLDPSDPQAPTLHALLIGTNGHERQALQLLRQVEAAHPRYSRAWLVEGLLYSSMPRYGPQAIRAWQRFVQLQPHSPLAANVRKLIAATRRAERLAR
jgi:cytochrome c-type biogenesis protein CcmH/NrfG